MPSTAGSVCLQAAYHLNDGSQLVYTTALLLPYLNMAIQELDAECAVYEVTPMRRGSITIEVPIASVSLPQYPVDYVETVALYERPNDSTQAFIEVKEFLAIDKQYIAIPQTEIVQWVSRGPLVYINPPSSAREVSLEYIAGFTTAASSGTAIDIEASKLFLSLTTARNAARDAGNSKKKADDLEPEITRARDRVIRRLQKNTQTAMGTRRRPYSGRGN